MGVKQSQAPGFVAEAEQSLLPVCGTEDRASKERQGCAQNSLFFKIHLSFRNPVISHPFLVFGSFVLSLNFV